MKKEATTARSYTFPKSERLHSKKLIQLLFRKGNSIFTHPLKVIYLQVSGEVSDTNQVLFTVSKKTFPKAVHRNRIKRLLREAYRLNKHDILSHLSPDIKIILCYIYVGREIPDYEFIESKLKDSLKRLKSDISKTPK